MRISDYFKLTLTAVTDNRLRSGLTVLGISIGIGAVVLLTSIGEGLNKFVINEFTQFGTTIVEIAPGKTQTMGGSLGSINTVRPLSIDDTIALRKLPNIEAATAIVYGNAEVEGNQRLRRTTIYGTDPDFTKALSFTVGFGTFLPDDNPHAPRPTAVLGTTVSDELFGKSNPLGEFIRIGGFRFRVVGVMNSKGQMMGIDLDDTVYLPTARAMELFARESLMEIHLQHSESASAEEVKTSIERLLIERHGTEDFTVTMQEQMMGVLDSILNVLTQAVAGLGAISLVVGGIGILTIMTIAVRERTNEIGLLRALGATQKQVLSLFLGEAVILAAIGAVIGLTIGAGGAWLIHFLAPVLPVNTPVFYMALATIVALIMGLVAGVLPARNASKMAPVDALRAE